MPTFTYIPIFIDITTTVSMDEKDVLDATGTQRWAQGGPLCNKRKVTLK